MWDFVVDKVALGQVFAEYFGFLCQSSFHQFLHNHLSSGARINAELVPKFHVSLHASRATHPNL
jgi:hypothetical protein